MTSNQQLEKDVLDADTRVGRPMALGPAHALAALFLEDANLRPARFAFDDGDDARLGDERGAGEDLTAVLLDEENTVVGQLGAGLAGGALDEDEGARRDLHLTAAGLDDGVHDRHLCKGDSVLGKWLSCKDFAAHGRVSFRLSRIRSWASGPPV